MTKNVVVPWCPYQQESWTTASQTWYAPHNGSIAWTLKEQEHHVLGDLWGTYHWNCWVKIVSHPMEAHLFRLQCKHSKTGVFGTPWKLHAPVSGYWFAVSIATISNLYDKFLIFRGLGKCTILGIGFLRQFTPLWCLITPLSPIPATVYYFHGILQNRG